MWEISNSLQTVCFLWSIITGVILSVFYDVLSSLRKAGLNSDIAIFFQDIFFFIIASPVIFLFLLATTNGEVRFYIIFGIIIGFFSFKLTLSKILVLLLSKVFVAFSCFFNFIARVFNKIIIAIEVSLGKKYKKTAFFLKKASNTLKKLLKKQQ